MRKLWFSGWYDGPTTGLALFDSSEYWFVMVTADEPGRTWDYDPRVYLLHRLTGSQLARAWAEHRTAALAGLPGCLHKPACPTDVRAPAESPAGMWERWAEQEDQFASAPAVGWFRNTERL